MLSRNRVWLGAVALSVGIATMGALAQVDDAGAAPLGALTSELRQLRIAVQQLARDQTQTQALGVYLSVQQGRILQVANRLDQAQRDLEAATVAAQDIASRLDGLVDSPARVTDPDERAAIEQGLAMLKREQATVALREQQARQREMTLRQALQTEESRWSDLVVRLEGLIRETQ